MNVQHTKEQFETTKTERGSKDPNSQGVRETMLVQRIVRLDMALS